MIQRTMDGSAAPSGVRNCDVERGPWYMSSKFDGYVAGPVAHEGFRPQLVQECLRGKIL